MIDVERLKHDLEYWDEVAPDGAEYYITSNMEGSCINPGFYFESVDRYVRCVGVGSWWKDSDITAIPRPTPKQWSGPEDGLPPIGSECTIEDNGRLQYGADHAGKAMEVVAHVENCAVLRLDWGLGCFELSVLRPIRTEKERVVEAAMKKWIGSNINTMEWRAREDFLGAAYDAGFLKMPESDQ